MKQGKHNNDEFRKWMKYVAALTRLVENFMRKTAHFIGERLLNIYAIYNPIIKGYEIRDLDENIKRVTDFIQKQGLALYHFRERARKGRLNRLKAKAEKKAQKKPVKAPNALVFLSGLAYPKCAREAVRGDIEERFKTIAEDKGRLSAAKFILWNIKSSLTPLVLSFARKFIIKVLEHVGMHVVIKHFFG